MFPDLLTATNASDGSVSLSWRDGVASNAYYFVDLTATPDIAHFGPTDLPLTFSAVLSDFYRMNDVVYQWASSDPGFEFSSPNAQSTEVTCSSLPSWGTYSMSVSASVGWYTLWSSLHSTCGTNETPQVGLTIDCQSVLLLNDDNRPERYYAVSIELNSDVATNGHITVVHEGDVEAAFFSDRGTNRVGLVDMDFTVESSCRYGFYISCSKCGAGSLSVLCTFSDGGQVERTHFYRVIEPICHWVSNEMDETGRMHVNPSRLVRGERSTFRVGVNQGSFLPSEVQWLTKGVTMVSTSEWDLVVIPTSDAAAAAICPSFNDDAEQPIMAMPIVEKRRIPIRGYVVTPPEGVEVDDNWIGVMVDWANIVYRQVGIEFYLISVETNVADSTLWNLTYNKWSVENGERKKVLSSEAESLVNTYTGGDCVEVYLVGQTHDVDAASSGAKTLGFWTDEGIVVGYDRPTALAHELGHALGLEDCYMVSNGVELPGLRDTVSGSLFSDKDRDFYGDVSGRGFYPRDVTVATILSRLLMNGNALGGMDIPAGAVKAFPEEDVDSPQAMDIPVGYLYFHQSDQEVFSE